MFLTDFSVWKTDYYFWYVEQTVVRTQTNPIDIGISIDVEESSAGPLSVLNNQCVGSDHTLVWGVPKTTASSLPTDWLVLSRTQRGPASALYPLSMSDNEEGYHNNEDQKFVH